MTVEDVPNANIDRWNKIAALWHLIQAMLDLHGYDGYRKGFPYISLEEKWFLLSLGEFEIAHTVVVAEKKFPEIFARFPGEIDQNHFAVDSKKMVPGIRTR
jgi:hypothetical protein